MTASSVQINSIKAVIFDIGGVLLDFDHSRTWKSLAKLAGAGWEEVRDYLKESRLRIGHELGEMSSEEIFRQYSQKFQPDLAYEDFCSAWAQIFSEKKDVIEVVRSISQRVSIYALSNTDPIHFEYIVDNYNFLDLFGGRILSFEVGSRKPDEGIFRAAINLAGCYPDACLFFDDIEEHVRAAAMMGIASRRFVSAGQMKKDLFVCGLINEKDK